MKAFAGIFSRFLVAAVLYAIFLPAFSQQSADELINLIENGDNVSAEELAQLSIEELLDQFNTPGVIDDGDIPTPEQHLWVSSKPDWCIISDELPQQEQGPE